VTPITGCVISLDEEDRIEHCLRSLSFCDEVVVLDSGSSDRTRQLAEACGARVETQDFLGYSAQKQRCVDLALHDWIFSLDCDEAVTEELSVELRSLARHGLAANGPAGFRVPRSNIYLGRAMRHGTFWPDRKLRLFDRRRARWGGTNPHDRVELIGAHPIEDLNAAIEHISYRSLDEHRDTVQRFAEVAAEAMAAEGQSAGSLSPWSRGTAALFKSLVLKVGFLDGWRGFLAAWMSARYDFRKYALLRSRKPS